MKARFLLFLPLLLLSACYTISNHHPFNAIPLEMGDTSISTGFCSLNNIFYLGTFSPDSMNVQLHSEETEVVGAGAPFCYHGGLGNGFSAAFQAGATLTNGMRVCSDETLSLDKLIQLKAHLIKSFALYDNLYLAVSPAFGISGGVVAPGRRYNMKYTHKGMEIPLTLSYQWQNPFKNKDNYPSFVFSGTLRGARDYFKGDINCCGPGVWATTWYYNQPQNAIDRYAAMAHIDLKLHPRFAVTLQYGREYSKGKDYSDYCPVFYGGIEIGMTRKRSNEK